MRKGLIVSLVLMVGCGSPSPEQINTWKGTQKGPGKLHDLLADDAAPPNLRGLAMGAMVEIGLGPDAVGLVKQASEVTRPQVVHEAIASLAALLGASATTAGPTTPTQRAAKDALFEVRGFAPPADRQRIDTLLIQWTTADLAARSSQGGEATEKILTAIGLPAAPALLPLMRPGPDLLIASSLIGAIGDANTQMQAAKTLEGATRGGAVIGDSTLQAIGLVGGQEATRFLLDCATKCPGDARQKALFALASGKVKPGDPQILAGALAIAGNGSVSGDTREAAFQVLEKLGPASVPGLTHIFADANTQARFRAVEAAIAAGGASGIGPTLAALSQDQPMKSADLDELVVHFIVKLSKEAVPGLRTVIGKKPTPLATVTALRALAQVGTSKDVDVVTPLLADKTACPTVKTTIADEAKKAQAALAKR